MSYDKKVTSGLTNPLCNQEVSNFSEQTYFAPNTFYRPFSVIQQLRGIELTCELVKIHLPFAIVEPQVC